MYIAPNSTIHVLNNVNLDNTYENTIFFSSKSEQQNWFLSKKKYSFEKCTYVRQENVIRVEINPDNLYDCNYLMFKNSSFGDKWFYAFITRTRYVGNTAAEIFFVIDVMQTWFFDVKMKPCFVEREHSLTDEIGDNLLSDELETGEYIARDFISTGKTTNYKIVVAATFDKNYADVSGNYYSGIYSGLTYNVFDTAAEVNEFISGVGAKIDGIVAVFMMPSDFISEASLNPNYYEITINKNYTDIDGYIPKNKKLFTYPYNYLYVTNLNGNTGNFPYEYFSSDNCVFGMTGDMSCNPQILIFPRNYKGITANFNEKMVLDGFPQCTYVTDTFKAWLAQSAVQTTLDLGGGIAQTAVSHNVGQAQYNQLMVNQASGAAMGVAAAGLVGGIPIAAVMGGIAVAGILANVLTHSFEPNHAHNTQGNSASVAFKIKDFAFIHTTIRKEFAEIIDNYWSRYGYPCRRTKIPNRNVRKNWTYTKTINCNVVGNIPVDDIVLIKTIYNNGVTFWRDGDNIGNYLLDNPVY